MSDWKETGETEEAKPIRDSSQKLGPQGIESMQGVTDTPLPSAPVEPEDKNPANPPPEHKPKVAIGEAGDAERAESGAEKTEKERFYGYGGLERGG